MAKRLKLSSDSTERMYRVRRRLRLEGRDDLWTLRVALSRSLQEETKLDTLATSANPSVDAKSSKRKEIDVATLVQKDGLLFRALMQQYYGKKLADEEYEDLLLEHLEHGLHLLDQETARFSGYEYLAAVAKKGLQDLGGEFQEPSISKSATIVVGHETGYGDVLSIRIGVETTTSEPHIIDFNKTDEHDNNYMGIVGRPGSGKTYFVKHFLQELRRQSNFRTHFVIFDYAKGDIAEDKEFLKKTRAELIRVGKQPIPLNIFRVPDSSHQARRLASERIVGIVRDVEASIGKVQEQNLYEAILSAYENVIHDDEPYPDFNLIRDELNAINSKPDSLTSVFRPLTEHNLFAPRGLPVWDSLVNKTVVFDIHKLPALKDLCVFFVLNELYRQLMLLPDSNVDPRSKAREMRTIIVLDEAHHFLRSKKRVGVLENLIREIRSKGASVILLSQSPDDYDQADFNFLEMLEFVFVLGCNPSSHRFLQQAFGVSADRAKKLIREVVDLEQGEAVGKGKSRGMMRLGLCR